MRPFGSAQLPHSCVRDTDQLVELALIGMPDVAAQKNPVVNLWDRAVLRALVEVPRESCDAITITATNGFCLHLVRTIWV